MKRGQKRTSTRRKEKKILIHGTLKNPADGSVFRAKMTKNGQMISFKPLVTGREDLDESLFCGSWG
jgi:hypothetical protein